MPALFNPQWMLVYGLITSYFIQENHAAQKFAKKWSKHLLQLSIVLLGSKLSIKQVLDYGAHGAGITFVSLILIFSLGHFLRKFIPIDKNQSLLLSAGTAICGGSAIAALAPVLSATGSQMGMAMGVVFILNALSVFIFPTLGEILALSQEQFGTFCALAIHDTSSVVAAASLYGAKSLEVATTLKLTRALWIIPMTLFFSVKSKNHKAQLKIPLFIIGFVLTSILFSYVEELGFLKESFSQISKLGLSLTLFLMGMGMNLQEIKSSGLQSILYGVILWAFTIFASLGYLFITSS